jgi:phasin family protein
MADVSRQAAEATQETIRTAVETASRAFQSSTDQIARSFGLSGEHGEDLARQATQNLEGSDGVQRHPGARLSGNFARVAGARSTRFAKNIEGVQALASFRNVQDVVAAQTELVRDNIQQIVNKSRQIAESSARVADEAAQTLTEKKAVHVGCTEQLDRNRRFAWTSGALVPTAEHGHWPGGLRRCSPVLLASNAAFAFARLPRTTQTSGPRD